MMDNSVLVGPKQNTGKVCELGQSDVGMISLSLSHTPSPAPLCRLMLAEVRNGSRVLGCQT